MTQYKRRPIIVEAFQWQQDVVTMNHKHPLPDWLLEKCVVVNKNLEVFTVHGTQRVQPGDWIVNEKGNLSVMNPRVFDMVYEAVG